MSYIRPYRASDRADIYCICVATGADGEDASGRHLDDTVIPDVFAGPYLKFEPGLAFVVDTGEGTGDTAAEAADEAADRVAGYILAAADTRAFVDRYREEWLPGFAAKYPRESQDGMVLLGHTPERMLIPEVDDYPAHLHIDLLPELQGEGWGRALMRTVLGALAERGIRHVHLSLSATNAAARAFYDRLGFHELPSSTADEPVLGISTDAAV
jgi:ribosomal protein S18 acetylase RimI-like enzyme